MNVGLFLDVDGVLTDKAINLQYAQFLKVEDKLVKLEKLYANRKITNQQFNAGFVPLFRGAGFTRNFARKHFGKIQMRTNASDLISATPNTFLVSSGPSFFIDTLAERHKLPKDRVLCSQYVFDREGSLKECIKPVNSAMKANFVKEHAKRFEVSIGVGDTEQDIEFLGHCNMRILMAGNRLEYFSVRELQPIIDVIGKLQTGGSRVPADYLIRDTVLLKRCEDILHASSSFDRPITVATQILEVRIRNKVGAPKELVGENLVCFAFNEELSKTKLRVASDDPGDQRGFTQILRGFVPAFRNKTHHHITDGISQEEAMRIVGFIDVLLRVVDDSVKVK
ncbi:TIGR02391 family protein [Bradyrhizobium erythrophlei]|uniref:phosphoserine phosphatase n=1 Tax=Bradyrhizobium erythrophlei TaxID=1437360 RepID=A0A1M5UGK1_9BRAD|nr:TIGR02391 family protein [Bradyrhizobium erythrophlei]SHH62109.1 Phosphoserine phosphatase [Bradyrhizobium erythrophlei]